MRLNVSELRPETLSSLLERKRLFDAAWVVCWISLLAAVAIPWAFSVLEIDLTRAALFVFLSGAGYLMFAAATDRLSSQLSVVAAMRLMPVASVLLLGILWHLVGGLANPTFLIAFALPVVINGVVMIGRQALATAALSSIVAFVVALVESHDLRWYIAGGRPEIWRLLDGLARVIPARPDVFPDVRTPPAYQFTILVTFVIVQFLVAFLTTPLAAILLRLDNRLRVSHEMLNEVQGLFHAVLRGEPDPGVIVYADTCQVVQASDSFFHRMLVRPSDLPGKTLFDLVKFDDQDGVRQALRAERGELPFCVYRIDGEVRVGNLSFYRTTHGGVAYLYVGWLELTELYHLSSAFEALDEPLLLVTGAGRLTYSNRAARDLFGGLHFGKPVDDVPSLHEMVEAHRKDADGREPLRHTIASRPYLVHRSPTPLPGAGGISTIFWLHCTEKEDALFEQAVRDPLTGAYNRRFFDEALTTQVERRRRGHHLALGYFDLDDFKKINDRDGHAAGDAALQAFVAAIRSELRDSDVLARRGGDEFSALFVDCDTAVAKAAIDRVYARVAKDGVRFEGRVLPLSFSAGIAACHLADTVDSLLERADRSLYEAKAAGKGRCSVLK